MPPSDSQPPLTWWSNAWRYTLVIAIAGVAWFELAAWQIETRPQWFWLDLSAGLTALVLLHWRRRHPVAVNVVIGLLTAFSASAGGPATLALMSLSTRRRWREIVPIGALGIAGSLVLEYLNPVATTPTTVLVPSLLAIIAITIGWGMYLGSRRELLATLRQRAETAETEQAARVSQARTAERTRIAREMHDVLAHRISLVTMHAGALAYRDDLDGRQVRETAAVIQANSHQAMIELREVLGILREDPGDAAPELPQPSAADVDDLVAQARATGMRVDLASTLALDAVPDTLGRTVYRVVQEGLTNVRKHAPDTLVRVAVDGSPADGVRVRVQNPMPVGSPIGVASGGPASGLGLVGLTERTALVGGRLSHRITPDREFVLDAWLPWPA